MGTMKCLIGNIMHSQLKWYVVPMLFAWPFLIMEPTQFLFFVKIFQDKVTLKTFAAIVEAGKLERALDLVERLHLEKSFEIAMTIADNHRKLVDFIEHVKDRRFPLVVMDYDADDDNDRTDFATDLTEFHHNRSRISPENNSIPKRTLEDSHARQVRTKFD